MEYSDMRRYLSIPTLATHCNADRVTLTVRGRGGEGERGIGGEGERGRGGEGRLS